MATTDDAGVATGSRGATDTDRLHELGYAQELKRGMGAFSNFAVSFTIISILSGCLTLYYFGMQHGGPPTMLWGWLLVGGLVLVVGFAMAEVCSSYPTAGGLYYWAAKLAPGNSGPAWSWFTGWFNLLGQVAVTAGIDFGLSFFIGAFIAMVTNSATWLSPGHTIGILAVVLFVHGLLNTFGVRLVALLNDISVWWHILGVLIIVSLLFIAPSSHTHQSASFLFGSAGVDVSRGVSGFTFFPFVFLLGLLNAQYTFTGYDASAHMTEETMNAAVAGPKGIVNSIWVSLVAGFILLLGVSMAIPSKFPITNVFGTFTGYADVANIGTPAPAVIFEYALGKVLAEIVMLIVIGAQFYCGMSSVTANSRMIYAFSRDGAIPGSRFWHKINKRTRTPTNSIWFAAAGAFILALPYLWNPVAYAAVTSIAVIGLYIAYVLPVLVRRINSRAFVPGPWQLGRWSALIGWIAIVWVAFIAILFCLPQYSPVTAKSFNYTPVAVGAVLLFAGLWYLLSARKWFKGPKVQGSPEELAAIERDLESV
jgi:amino acid permease (GABA permease)